MMIISTKGVIKCFFSSLVRLSMLTRMLIMSMNFVCYVMLSLEMTFYLCDKKLENVGINNFNVFFNF